MTREQEIESLRVRLQAATDAHKRKTATLILDRLCRLILQQINDEMRISA